MRLCRTLLALLLAPVSSYAEGFPDWAFPGPAPGNSDPASESRLIHVPGSAVTMREQDARKIHLPPDWFPKEHAPMPMGVGVSRGPDLWACGYCHLTDGSGRPENATLQGLPAAYIREQVAAFRSGERKSAKADWRPTQNMANVANNATDTEIEAAAEYFSNGRFTSRVRLIESANAPRVETLGYVWGKVPGPKEPLGRRIVEVPVDSADFEKRNPHTRFVAYVPKGSLARGRRLAESQGCATCHGEGLRGGVTAVAPPIAGRSPTYLFRQLYGFKLGQRSNAGAEPMRRMSVGLDVDQMIDLAAYVASQRSH